MPYFRVGTMGKKYNIEKKNRRPREESRGHSSDNGKVEMKKKKRILLFEYNNISKYYLYNEDLYTRTVKIQIGNNEIIKRSSSHRSKLAYLYLFASPISNPPLLLISLSLSLSLLSWLQ